ncbi:AAEL017150-PA [Aedes aegypti]|uniref:AAEL017150-PA n=1 Tax=Aedes aegypti TaxID=7159 RepID=J9HYF7_AEDAE|nr:AAEL017150-PA [Aedes aegypti]
MMKHVHTCVQKTHTHTNTNLCCIRGIALKYEMNKLSNTIHSNEYRTHMRIKSIVQL